MDFLQWRASGAAADDWLRYVASHLALGTLPASVIRRTIDELMNQGHYADDYLPALDADAGYTEHLVPALRAAMRNFGIDMPDRMNAIRHIIAFHLHGIADGRLDPFTGFSRVLDEASWEPEFREGSAHWLGDSFGVEKLISLYYTADDVRASCFGFPIDSESGARLEEIRQAMREETQRWLEENRTSLQTAVQSARSA